MNAIEFLFTEQGEPLNYLIKTETAAQEERLKAIARTMLQSITEGGSIKNDGIFYF